MKLIKNLLFLLGILLFANTLKAQETGNYILIIDTDTIRINLNEKNKMKLSNGNSFLIELTQPNELYYEDNMISFQYTKNLSVSNSIIDSGIEQCAIISANGNGFLIQKYNTFNPSMLTEIMLTELIKESINYGYTVKKEVFEKQLLSGQSIKGITATLTYKGENEIYTVATYGKKDEGILVVTMLLNEDFKEQDQKMIDLFLNSLKLKN